MGRVNRHASAWYVFLSQKLSPHPFWLFLGTEDPNHFLVMAQPMCSIWKQKLLQRHIVGVAGQESKRFEAHSAEGFAWHAGGPGPALHKPVTMMHHCNPSTQEVEAGGSEVQDQARTHLQGPLISSNQYGTVS